MSYTQAWCAARDVLAPQTERERVLFDALVSAHEATFERDEAITRLVNACNDDSECAFGDLAEIDDALRELSEERKGAAKEIADHEATIATLEARVAALESADALATVTAERDAAIERAANADERANREAAERVATQRDAARKIESLRFAAEQARQDAARNAHLAGLSEDRARDCEARLEALRASAGHSGGEAWIDALRAAHDATAEALAALEGKSPQIKKATRRSKKSGILP